MNKLIIFVSFLSIFTITSCCNFNEQVAIDEFTLIKPDAEIASMNWQECSGTFCECVYVYFEYNNLDSESTMDTTLQYWLVDDSWISRKEYLDRKN